MVFSLFLSIFTVAYPNKKNLFLRKQVWDSELLGELNNRKRWKRLQYYYINF